MAMELAGETDDNCGDKGVLCDTVTIPLVELQKTMGKETETYARGLEKESAALR